MAGSWLLLYHWTNFKGRAHHAYESHQRGQCSLWQE